MSLTKSDTAHGTSSSGPKSGKKATKNKTADATATATASATEQAASARPPVAAVAPSHDEIAARAYAIFEKRGGVQGSSSDDWQQAERELTEQPARG